MKKALVIGAGNIGRGVVGYLLNKSGYNLEFYDVDFMKIKEIQKNGGYSVFIDGKPLIESQVKNFHAISSQNLESVIAANDLIFCCVYEGAFANIAENIANVIKQRNSDDVKNIMLCVNSLKAPSKFKKLIEAHLSSELDKNYMDKNLGINQVMVLSAGLSVPDDIAKKYPHAVMITSNPHLEIDGESFKGQYPKIENVEFVKNAEARIFRKVYVGNMRHTMSAFMGDYEEYSFISEAQSNPFIRSCIIGAFKESHKAVTEEYNFGQKEDQEWVSYMTEKLDQTVKDPIKRVAANPKLKLSRYERFIGPAILCLQHNIVPFYITIGIAYGIHYLIKNNLVKSVEQALNDICELNAQEDFILYQLIESQYQLINYRKEAFK